MNWFWTKKKRFVVESSIDRAKRLDECSACGSKNITIGDYHGCPHFCFSRGINITTPEGAKRFLDGELRRLPELESLLIQGISLQRRIEGLKK